MQITRPNTGTSPTDMSSQDLNRKYRLVCSCEKLEELAKVQSEGHVERVKQVKKEVGVLWQSAFDDSFHFGHANGLAPRRQRISLVNGPVLHIMNALERAVMFRSEKEKALRIMRAQVGSRRIVGVRFPSDDEAYQNLQEQLQKVHTARRDAGVSYTDEDLEEICQKSLSWATTERKTMKSFFQVKNPPSSGASIPPSASRNTGKLSSTGKRSAGSSAPTSAKKKTKTMLSYFAKKS